MNAGTAGTAGSQGRAFIERVRSALGRESGPPAADFSTHLFQSADQVADAASAVREDMRARADELLDAIAESAATAGWRVSRVASPEDAADVIAQICAEAGIKTALRSDQAVFDAVPVDAALTGGGVELRLATVDVIGGVDGLRDAAFEVDAGITGVDYAIAETGTVVLHPRRGLSRLVSLAPGRHIAILNRGDVLPSLDELFTLERAAFLDGTIEGSMNLISGPSRTGDIAATIVDGIHGPFEVFLVIVG